VPGIAEKLPLIAMEAVAAIGQQVNERDGSGY
jgi:hypothetical protein